MAYTPPPLPGETNFFEGGLRLTQPDHDVIWLSAKKTLQGRILPAHDWTGMNPNDGAFDASWSPYRVAGTQDANGHPRMGYWAIPLAIYNRVGTRGDTFVSPMSLASFGEAAGPDPIDEVRSYAWNREDLKHLVKTEKRTEDPVVPNVRQVYILNAAVLEPGGSAPKIGVMPISGTAYKHLLDQLNTYVKPGTQPRDPQWPDYALGDVTAPATAPMFYTSQVRMSTGAGSFNAVVYNTTGTLNNYPVGDDVLIRRARLYDKAVWNIQDYQSLVDWMVMHSSIPVDLVRTVCGSKAEIKAA